MEREPVETGRLPPLRWLPSHHLLEHRGRSPDPSKTHPRHGALVADLGGNSVTHNGIQGRQRWRSGRSLGSTVAWCPALRWQTRRLEVVRRALPRNVPALVPRRVGGLLRLDLLQHGRQPLIVDDRARLHCLDLVEHLETERCSVELNREPPVRVVHHLHLLAPQATGQGRGIEDQHHPVVVQGQVTRDCALLPPGQDLVQIIGLRQWPMQVLGIRRVAAEARVVGGDEPGQPGVRRGHRGSPPAAAP
jgi:hypothetical protein